MATQEFLLGNVRGNRIYGVTATTSTTAQVNNNASGAKIGDLLLAAGTADVTIAGTARTPGTLWEITALPSSGNISVTARGTIRGATGAAGTGNVLSSFSPIYPGDRVSAIENRIKIIGNADQRLLLVDLVIDYTGVPSIVPLTLLYLTVGQFQGTIFFPILFTRNNTTTIEQLMGKAEGNEIRIEQHSASSAGQGKLYINFIATVAELPF